MLCTLLAVLPTAVCSADVITVPGDHDTIQAAISAAADGDEIVVSPGTYAETLTLLGKEVVLRSSDGAEVTILDGEGLADTILRAVSAETYDTVVQGFTFVNGEGGTGNNNCIDSNFAAGAIYIGFGSNLTVRDCIFDTNGYDVGLAAGGAICAFNGGLHVTDSTFVNNGGYSADEDDNTAFGGAIFMCNSSLAPDLTVERCVFDGNGPTSHGGAIFVQTDGTVTILDSDFIGNASSWGAGINVSCSTNQLGLEATALIQGCTFMDNTAGFGGGIFGQTIEAGYFDNPESTIEVNDCDFLGNVADASCCNTGIYWSLCWQDGVTWGTYFGGGLDLRASTGTIRLANSLFAANEAVDAAGFHMSTCGEVDFDLFGGTIEVANVTVADNIGEGVRLRVGFTGDMDLSNLIVTGNTEAQLPTEFLNPVDGMATIDVTYSNVEGGFEGAGNIDVDPGFVGDGDYRLAAGSAAIDAGDNTALDESIITDLAGDPRYVDDPDTADTGFGRAPIIDMGAYEFQAATCAADFNGDGVLNVLDFVAFQLAWQNSDPAADCDASGEFDVLDFVCFQQRFGEGC